MEGQRRQLTVMFCDMVDSTQLSTQLDPEALYQLNTVFLECCSRHIEASGGFIARYLGDGLLSYFCWPQAHEDDAERSVSAGLKIVEHVPRIVAPNGAQLGVRVGIATGLVVIGKTIGRGPAREQPVTGEIPNLAARLLQHASKNSVLVSETTKALSYRLFHFAERGPLRLKGFEGDVRAWQPLATRQRPVGRNASTQDVVGFVGREREIEELLTHWRACLAGEATSIVSILGDAGLGKSRLLSEFRRLIAADQHLWLEGGAARLFSHTPFFAIGQMLENWSENRPVHDDHRAVPSMGGSDTALPIGIAEIVAGLLGADTGSSDIPDGGRTPDEKRQQLMGALVELITRTADHRPIVMVLEDAQWADPSTCEMLAKLVQARPSRILFLFTSRDDVPALTTDMGPIGRIDLQALGQTEVSRLVQSLCPTNLSPVDLQFIVNRSGGIPLFAEELSRFLLRKERAGLSGIPSTVSDLLTARLDQLGALKGLAQTASVLGGAFDADILVRLTNAERTRIDADLCRLEDARVIVRDAGQQQQYSFKHALIREAAYDALLRDRRQSLHKKAANALTAQNQAGRGVPAEIIAYHWTRGNDLDKAVSAWRRAAAASMDRGAYREAQHALENAIAVIAADHSSALGDQALSVQSALVSVIQITCGYASPEAAAAAARASELAKGKSDDLRRQFAQLVNQWASASSGGDYVAAVLTAERLLSVVQVSGDAASLGIAHMAIMTSSHRMGDHTRAVQALSRGARYFAQADFRRRSGAIAQTYGNAAIISWLLGRHAKTRQYVKSLIRFGDERDQAYELVFCYYMAALSSVLLGDYENAARMAALSAQQADTHHFPQFAGVVRVVHGRALSSIGDVEHAAGLIDEGLQLMAAARNRAGITMYLAWKAEVQMQRGHWHAAHQTLDEALASNVHERYFQPEILRLRAEASKALGDLDGAYADLVRGLALAKEIGAKHLYQKLMRSRAVDDRRSFDQYRRNARRYLSRTASPLTISTVGNPYSSSEPVEMNQNRLSSPTGTKAKRPVIT